MNAELIYGVCIGFVVGAAFAAAVGVFSIQRGEWLPFWGMYRITGQVEKRQSTETYVKLEKHQ